MAGSGRLDDEISGEMKESAFPSPRKFLPEGTVDMLVTPRSIKSALRLKERREHDELRDYILEDGREAKKLLAIVLSMALGSTESRKAMQSLKEHGIVDSNLPMQYLKKQHFFCPKKSATGRNIGIHYRESADADTDEEEVWTGQRITNFCENQWQYLSPVFVSNSIVEDALDPHSILPFTKKRSGREHGAFGLVSEYEIHQSHLKGSSNEKSRPACIALKQIIRNKNDRRPLMEVWKKEAEILQMMNALNQPNIVRFLSAFQRHNEYFLMFEWADGGTLRDLWQQFERPGLSPGLTEATVSQLLGLATAISEAHYPENWDKGGFHFRHGDLKPENILWFKTQEPQLGMGTLKIADWGLAKQHNVVTALRNHITDTVWGTRRYEPPEEETQDGSLSVPGEEGPKRSRLYDIWAFGCIALEFLIWLIYGTEELNRFNESISNAEIDVPCFYQTAETPAGRKKARVHDIVVQWLQHMEQDPICSPENTALGDLLDLVKNRLLVVQLPRGLGSFLESSENFPKLQPLMKESRFVPIATTEEEIPRRKSAMGSPNIGSVPDTFNTQGNPQILVETPTSTHFPIPIPEKEFTPRSRPLGGSKFERVDALTLQGLMTSIFNEARDDYWFSGHPSPPRGPSRANKAGAGEEVQEAHSGSVGDLSVPKLSRTDYGKKNLSNVWNYHVDNSFASQVASALPITQAPTPTHNICHECRCLCDGIWNSDFGKSYNIQYLDSSRQCSLCDLIRQVLRGRAVTQLPTVTFKRNGSFLRLQEDMDCSLSILRSPDLKTSIDNDVQIGLPRLPTAGSQSYFAIIRKWLENCDRDHRNTKSPCPTGGPMSANISSISSSHRPGSAGTLPTRVIAVGSMGDEFVQLRETNSHTKGSWIALSHQWGSGLQYRTVVENYSRHKSGIRFRDLPATFRDAVTVTRALGCAYLWIDSICIIQGPGGDFNQEAKLMEKVYSGAYCVLAASRSPGHDSGFLQARNERKTVVLQQKSQNAPFYISETIDDFENHVLQGSLNTRGWVLQEHALARRTIYFTNHQTYFECGDGVRCETMTKMDNEMATLLGDPDFPRIIMDADLGEKIVRYQNLYGRYSRLGLSQDHDRPMAIDGLQARILKALKIKGGYGIFDEGDHSGENPGLLRRSLLWRRGTNTPSMRQIKFPHNHPISKIPSWSWMAYTGGIDYIRPDFNEVVWDDIRSPWTSEQRSIDERAQTDKKGGNITLLAQARDYFALHLLKGEGEIILDRPGGSMHLSTKCVILGKRKGKGLIEEKAHYVLIISATNETDREGAILYERVGVGYLPGKYIRFQGEGEPVRIK